MAERPQRFRSKWDKDTEAETGIELSYEHFPGRVADVTYASPLDGFHQWEGSGVGEEMSPKLFPLVLLVSLGSGTRGHLITLTLLARQSSAGRPCRSPFLSTIRN